MCFVSFFASVRRPYSVPHQYSEQSIRLIYHGRKSCFLHFCLEKIQSTKAANLAIKSAIISNSRDSSYLSVPASSRLFGIGCQTIPVRRDQKHHSYLPLVTWTAVHCIIAAHANIEIEMVKPSLRNSPLHLQPRFSVVMRSHFYNSSLSSPSVISCLWSSGTISISVKSSPVSLETTMNRVPS